MAENILKFKSITSDDVFKGVDKTYSTQTFASGSSLVWYYVDRSEETHSTLTDDMKNLFHSFGISREDEEDWFKVFNVADYYNAKRMVIAVIPQADVGSYIDGSTVRLNVPIGATSKAFTTFYGSTFAGYPDPITSKQISMDHHIGAQGGAYCYLFGDTDGTQPLPSGTFATGIIHPYSGNVDGGYNPNSGLTSFDQDNEDGTLSWAEAEAKQSPHLSATHWQNGDDGNDRPYGIALLDRGIFIIFDMYGRTDFIDNTVLSASSFWQSASSGLFEARLSSDDSVNVSVTLRKGIYFSGTFATESAKLTYRTIEQDYKNIYFCHCGQNEFNSTSNHTYNSKKAYFRPEEADSLWVTEVGLYDDNDDLLAYAKLSEPVEKNKLETLTFKVELTL